MVTPKVKVRKVEVNSISTSGRFTGTTSFPAKANIYKWYIYLLEACIVNAQHANTKTNSNLRASLEEALHKLRVRETAYEERDINLVLERAMVVLTVMEKLLANWVPYPDYKPGEPEVVKHVRTTHRYASLQNTKVGKD